MRPSAVVFVSALGLTLLLAIPVLRAPRERLIGHETVGRHHDAYTVIAQFERPRPLGHSLQQPVTDLAGAAVARLVGGVAAYNVVVLASFPLAALFAFLLARHLALSVPAAALAGLLFAFAPSHLAHAAYHPQIVQVQWIPLFFLALCRCLDRWTLARAAALLAASALLGFASFYHGFFAALLTPVALLVYPAGGAAGETAWRERLATAATLGAAGLAGALALRLSPARLGEFAEAYGFPASDLARYSARWQSYLLPPVDHALVGDAVVDFWRLRGVADGLIEQQLTVGFAPLILAAVALAAGLRRQGAACPFTRRQLGFVAALAATAVFASLAGGPGALLHRLVPLFRAYARFGIFAQLMLVLLAAAGFWVLTRRGPLARMAAVLLLAVSAVEYAPFPPWRWHPVLPTEAHRRMAKQPGRWKLLDCVSLPPQVAHSIFRFLPQPAEQLSPVVPDCAEPDLAAKLAALDVSHVVVRAGSPEDDWHRGRAPTGLVEEASFPDARLLRVEAEPAPLFVQAWRGFSWREYGQGRTFRWLGSTGEWSLSVRGREPLVVVLEVELHAFPGARRLDVGLDGTVVATLEVGTEPHPHRVGPLVLTPGAHRLEWRPQREAVIADSVLANGDQRALSLAVGDFRWLPAQPDPVGGDDLAPR